MADAYSFEPLITQNQLVLERAEAVIAAAGRLGSSLHPQTVAALAELLRTVNCYYSNLIENHDTHLIDIERAMRSDFSADSLKRDLQAEARAHIEVQIEIEKQLVQKGDLQTVSEKFLCWIHAEFYRREPAAFRILRDMSGKQTAEVVPGELRTYNVGVGRHLPPPHTEIKSFLARMAEVYDFSRLKGGAAVAAIAAAHHRLLWVHPFGDGNGRVARLMTDASLRRIGLAGHGLWTVARGLARSREKYLYLLDQADASRSGDLDGRGALSESGLNAFCLFFLETCEDQIEFMYKQLQVDAFADRIRAYAHSRENGIYPDMAGTTGRDSLRFRPDMSRLLLHLIYRGSIPRRDIPELLKLEERTSRRVVKDLITQGFARADTSRAPLRLSIPAYAVEYVVPGLVD